MTADPARLRRSLARTLATVARLADAMDAAGMTATPAMLAQLSAAEAESRDILATLS